MKRVMLIAAIVVLGLAGASRSAEPNPSNEMSLDLYQKLKGHFDAIYGAQTNLLEPINKEDSERNLKADASANKDALIKALTSPKAIHRELAARALEYCGDKKAAVDSLLPILNTDTDQTVRRAVAASLAKLPDASAVDPLLKGLWDTDDSVRSTCASALGNIKDNRASEGLLRILNEDTKPLVRMMAATALSKIKDPNSLNGLTKALESEKDERVKMAIAGAMRQLMGGNNAQTETVPSSQDAAGELANLSKEMKEVEEKLRADRHDVAVQTQGTSIEKKLATLIEQLNKSCNSSGQSNSENQQQNQQKQSGGEKNNGPKQAGSPLKNSQLGGAVPQGAMNAAQVADRQASWAKLPPAQRDQLLQAFREEMPERWRKRLEAYFLSIAVEEATKAENK